MPKHQQFQLNESSTNPQGQPFQQSQSQDFNSAPNILQTNKQLIIGNLTNLDPSNGIVLNTSGKTLATFTDFPSFSSKGTLLIKSIGDDGSGDGNRIYIIGAIGNSGHYGGHITIQGGESPYGGGTGGNVTIKGGDAGSASIGGTGADVIIQGGSAWLSPNLSGNVLLTPGQGLGGATNGKVGVVNTGTNLRAYLDATSLVSSNKTFTFPNSTGIFAVVTSGSGTSASYPVAVGQIYIDTAAAKVYVSVGTSSDASWVAVN